MGAYENYNRLSLNIIAKRRYDVLKGSAPAISLTEELKALEKAERAIPVPPAPLPPPPTAPTPGLTHRESAAVCIMRTTGGKIGAIKLHRDMTGLSLRESKDAVEDAYARMQSAMAYPT